ncbi:MAG: response regulator transcription factor [Mycobacterium leprae]
MRKRSGSPATPPRICSCSTCGYPDVPGEEVAREVRQFSLVPILVLTAKTATDDRIHCLELGADDYVTKPFSPREVILRVRAILRRAHSGLVDDAPTSYGDGEAHPR